MRWTHHEKQEDAGQGKDGAADLVGRRAAGIDGCAEDTQNGRLAVVGQQHGAQWPAQQQAQRKRRMVHGRH